MKLYSIRSLSILVVFVLSCLFEKVQASEWSEITQTDLNAASQIIKNSHPAFGRGIEDQELILTEKKAHEKFLNFATSVTSSQGYRAVLQGYAASFNDPHIKPKFKLPHSEILWPGFLVEWRGGNFTVFGSSLKSVSNGDILVSCDNHSVYEIARNSIGTFSRPWTTEANKIKSSSQLLLDYGNPFVTRVESCQFKRGEREYEHDLRYQKAQNDKAFKRAIKKFKTPKKYSVTQFGENGVWINLPGLSGGAYDLLDAIEARAQEFQQVEFVVVDVRGNGGGNSQLGTRLANVLDVPPYHPKPKSGHVHWRISDGNLLAIRKYSLNKKFSSSFRKHLQNVIEKAPAIRDTGGEFYPPLAAKSYRTLSMATSNGNIQEARIILLTDSACFSSCLLLAERFIQGGAIQVGQTTDVGNTYMEVHERPLPSGRATFSTMMKVNFNYPNRMGPYEPQYKFEGDINDTPAIKEWVLKLRSE